MKKHGLHCPREECYIVKWQKQIHQRILQKGSGLKDRWWTPKPWHFGRPSHSNASKNCLFAVYVLMMTTTCSISYSRQRQTSCCSALRVLQVVLLLLVVSTRVNAGKIVYTLLKGTGSNCVSVDPLPGSTLSIKYHLPDLKIKDREGKILGEEEPLDTEGMDEAEAALMQRQREVAIKRVSQRQRCYFGLII